MKRHMKQLSILCIALIALLSTSCEKVYGDGPVRTEDRHVGNFSGVDLRCSADVTFRRGADYRVEVTAQENILDILLTYVSNDRLVIRFKDDVRVRSHERIQVEVTAPDLDHLRVSGSGSIRTSGPLSPSRAEVEVSGSGNIYIGELNADYIDANVSGSGGITVADGSANELRSRISGSGNIDMINVPVSRATTTTSGSGDTYVHVLRNLDVTISGSGSVFYRGNPQINTRISGSGRVVHR